MLGTQKELKKRYFYIFMSGTQKELKKRYLSNLQLVKAAVRDAIP